MDGCTEAYNLTDCLLQLVLDGIKDHNKWDVPSLCVTVVIGVIATGFAFLTVIQGIAAPGRRKCSKDAIGNWSQKTKHHFNLSEFRRDSVAYTPVLKSDVLQPTLNGFEILPPDLPPHLNRSFGDDKRSKPYKKDDAYLFPASWLRLFTHLGVEQLVWDNVKKTSPTSADYLPSDVQAAPAYMDIDTIVVLAAAAGCYRLMIEPGSGCPVITGTDVGVRFRRDPFLGLVASFEYYGDSDSKRESSHEQAVIHQEDTLVDFQYCGSEPFSTNFSVGADPDITGPALKMNFSGKNSGSGYRCPHVGKSKLCRCWRLLIDLGKRHNFSWLLCADPNGQKGVFPAKRANVEGVLGAIVVQGLYWRRNHLSDEWVLKQLKRLRYNDWDSFWKEAGKREGLESFESFEPFALCLQFAIDVEAGQRLFFRLPQRQRSHLRCLIQQEMTRIDKVINDVETARCTQVEVYIRAATLMLLEPLEEFIMKELHKPSGVLPDPATKSKIGSTPRNILRLLNVIDVKEGEPLLQLYDLFLGLFSDCWAAEVDCLIQSLSALASTIGLEGTQTEAESGDDLKNRSDNFDSISFIMKQEDPMHELLIYRTVLLAIICLTALDNSAIIESGIGNQIVPFL